METRYDFRLKFVSHRGEVMTINIPHADDTATALEVVTAMNGIVNSDVVESVRGRPIGIYNADLIKTRRKDFDIWNA